MHVTALGQHDIFQDIKVSFAGILRSKSIHQKSLESMWTKTNYISCCIKKIGQIAHLFNRKVQHF
jgi:hypothetical protein